MTSEDTILNEIKHMRGDIGKLDSRMGGIEDAVKLVAVQANQIHTINREVASLWKIKDDCSAEMKIIRQFQASCPRDQITKMEHQQTKTLNNQWTAIKLLAGTMLTGFGILGAFIRWAGSNGAF